MSKIWGTLQHYFYNTVKAYVQKELVDFYDLKDDILDILNYIFYGYQFVPEPFDVYKPEKDAKGNITVRFTIFQSMSSDAKRELLKQLAEVVDNSISMLPSRDVDINYERMRTMDNIDEKYAITKEYKELLKLPKGVRKDADVAFLKKAALAFNKNPARYTMSEFRVDKKDFLNKFEKGL